MLSRCLRDGLALLVASVMVSVGLACGLVNAAEAASIPAPPFSECPAIGADPSCGILLVVNADNTVSVYGDSSVGPFDGGDDTLVGIVNDSSTPVTAITVSGPGSSLSLFDGDGICSGLYGSWNGSPGCPYGTTGYEGPGTNFVTDPSLPDSAEVDFTGGLAPGATAYFSLEGALTSAQLTARKGTLVNRYVVIGDSVAYGHGLNNPYTVPMIGTGSGVSQGPSSNAWPNLLNQTLGDTLNIRGSNCALTGDQLAISGAQASATNASSATPTPPTAFNYQCAGATRSEEGTELPAAGLASQPAALVTIQGGADDIGFAGCLTYVASHNRVGKSCVERNGNSTSTINGELSNVTSSLTSMIQQVSPYAKRVAVVDYYEPIPNPNDFSGSSSHPHGQVDPVCLGLQTEKREAYSVGVAVTTALNDAIIKAVNQAKAAGDTNITLVDITNVELHHEMCTGSPALFSGEPMSKSALAEDLDTILVCSTTGRDCDQAATDRTDIEEHTWRAAHPNSYGQQDIAKAVATAVGS